jgi:hypothetical protein
MTTPMMKFLALSALGVGRSACFLQGPFCIYCKGQLLVVGTKPVVSMVTQVPTLNAYSAKFLDTI